MRIKMTITLDGPSARPIRLTVPVQDKARRAIGRTFGRRTPATRQQVLQWFAATYGEALTELVAEYEGVTDRDVPGQRKLFAVEATP